MRTIKHNQYTEIVADDGKYLNRVSNEQPCYFKRGAMLSNDTEADYEEVDESVKLAYDKTLELEIPSEENE